MTRGIVTCGGGKVYFLNAYINCWLLRQKGCELPIEWFYMGEEMTPKMLEAAKGLSNVTLRDLGNNNPDNRKSNGGWQSKSEAICESSFDELIWLDADCFPTRNPASLFNHSLFKESGAVLWPDPFAWDHRLTEIQSKFNVPSLPNRQIESGVMMFDKTRCSRALEAARGLNRNWQDTYQILFGDKDTFPIGFHQTNTPYVVCPHHVGHCTSGMVHYDFDGELLFVHLVGGKFQWHGRPYVREELLPGTNSVKSLIPQLKQMGIDSLK